MSSWAWRRFVLDRTRELDAKLGSFQEEPPPAVECDPSWGLLGSLARQLLGPQEYARLVRLDAQIAALEHQRAAPDGRIDMDVAAVAIEPEAQPETVWRREPL